MKSNIASMYRKHNSLKIFQGDIFRDVNVVVDYNDDYKDFNEFVMPYIIVLSQDCDLEQDFRSYQKYVNFNDEGVNLLELDMDNCSKDDKDIIVSMYDKFLPSILICPAFPAEQLKDGTHLNNYNNYSLPRINSRRWKIIKNNETPRYHFLNNYPEYQIPKLVIDFKRYYTLPTHYLYSVFEESYMASLNELYRERISQRFVNYLSRIGLPD